MKGPVLQIDPRVRLVAISLLTSLAMLGIRFTAYLYSGSLAILADSVHSLSDIVGGIIALVAIKVAIKEPDPEHPYGHGKAESLGSLGVSLALVALLLYVAYEAVLRITEAYDPYVEFTPLIPFLLLITVLIDYWRSRALSRGALKYGSLLLASDALHYSSDLYATSSVLIMSILGIVFGEKIPILIMDSILGIAIAAYFAAAAIRLAKISIDELMDRAPTEAIEMFRKACRELDLGVKSVRARRAGSRIFIDAVVEISGNIDLVEAHKIIDTLEERIKSSTIRNVDLVIHMEPRGGSTLSEIASKSSEIASKVTGVLGVHDVEVFKDEKGYHVRMHIEVSPTMSLSEASKIASEVERRIKSLVEGVESVLVHIEPKRGYAEDLYRIVTKAIQRDNSIKDLAGIKSVKAIYLGKKLVIDVICVLPGNMDVNKAHDIVSRIEALLREEVGEKASITIRYHSE
ncbi:cation-efflux pump [Desulfurococcaceae archaeon AG1]|jgi:cation diffusion facilitator family transporter|nr:MAG: hypothetical protein DJ555_08140 [Desulfurococcaceae archaeon]GAY25928.1 cation-efflux pump [Desulfurococcaceae archaeon AG1]